MWQIVPCLYVGKIAQGGELVGKMTQGEEADSPVLMHRGSVCMGSVHVWDQIHRKEFAIHHEGTGKMCHVALKLMGYGGYCTSIRTSASSLQLNFQALKTLRNRVFS